MAGGAVALEAWLSRVLRSAFAAVIMISGAVGAPISMPLLPVHSFIVYQRWLGLQPSTGERVKLRSLAAILCRYVRLARTGRGGRKGLCGFAAGGAETRRILRPQLWRSCRGRCVGAPWHLPAAISAHESYFLWGPRVTTAA